VVPSAPGAGGARDRGVRECVRRSGGGEHEAVELAYPRVGESRAEPLVENVDEGWLDAEHVTGPYAQAGVAANGCLDHRGDVDLGMVGAGQ